VQSWIQNCKEAGLWGNINFGEGAARIDGYGKRSYGKPSLRADCCAPADTDERQPYE
jgi:hypothetical protein